MDPAGCYVMLAIGAILVLGGVVTMFVAKKREVRWNIGCFLLFGGGVYFTAGYFGT